MARLGGQVATKTFDGRLNHAIVAPPQHLRRNPGSQPHRSLHHLEGPGRVRARCDVVAVEGELRGALQVAVDECGNAPLRHAFINQDVEAHAIRDRGHDDSVQHRAGLEAAPFNGEVVQPAPPRGEAVEAPHRRPQLRDGDRKCEGAVVLDDVRRAGHPLTLRAPACGAHAVSPVQRRER